VQLALKRNHRQICDEHVSARNIFSLRHKRNVRGRQKKFSSAQIFLAVEKFLHWPELARHRTAKNRG
jgi:hypothetical protein